MRVSIMGINIVKVEFEVRKMTRDQLLRYMRILGLITGLGEEHYSELRDIMNTFKDLSDYQSWYNKKINKT